MARLTHSPRAFIRAVQMSSFDVVAVVEGIDDREFYSVLLAAIKSSQKVRIALASELEGFKAGNGKVSLLGVYRKLRRRKALKPQLGGSSRKIVFWMDKDIDDIVRKLARSEHVVYTPFYGSENHIFVATDLARAVANAASLDVESVRERLGTDPTGWLRSAAASWSDWTAYCIAVHCNGVGAASYGAHKSLFHDGGVKDSLREQEVVASAACRCASAIQFNTWLAQAHRRVRRLHAASRLDSVFNGKWYVPFLQQLAADAAAGRQYDAPGFRDLRRAGLAFMDADSPSLQGLRRALAASICANGRDVALASTSGPDSFSGRGIATH